MSQLQPTVPETPALPLSTVAPRGRGRLHLPGWLILLLKNRKSRFGLVLVGFVVVVALIAPWISVEHPTDFNLLAAKQAPSWHHLTSPPRPGADVAEPRLRRRRECGR
jgi:hypothetical protein